MNANRAPKKWYDVALSIRRRRPIASKSEVPHGVNEGVIASQAD